MIYLLQTADNADKADNAHQVRLLGCHRQVDFNDGLFSYFIVIYYLLYDIVGKGSGEPKRAYCCTLPRHYLSYVTLVAM